MALKLLFLSQNQKNHLEAGSSAPRALCDTLELHQLVQHGAQIGQIFFVQKKITFGSSPLPLSKILVALLIEFTKLQTDSSSDCITYETS